MAEETYDEVEEDRRGQGDSEGFVGSFSLAGREKEGTLQEAN